MNRLDLILKRHPDCAEAQHPGWLACLPAAGPVK